MSTRTVSIIWSMLLFLTAILTGGWVAQQLHQLEESTLQTWAERLEGASQENARKTSRWLEGQANLLVDIVAATPQIMPYLHQIAALQPQTIPPENALLETFAEKAGAKYGLTHVYVFSAQGQLLFQQPEALTVPLKVREGLALAYQTGLEKYMFFTTFSGKEWFVASRRIKDGRANLGYIAYVTEASAMLADLYDLWQKPQWVDFNLARRVDDRDVFFAVWRGAQVQLRRFGIQQSQLPLFGGFVNRLQALTLASGEERLLYVADIQGFPFWQYVSSVPLKTAFAEVRKARFFYLLGYGVLLLALLAFLVGLMRRIIRPDAPSWAEIIRENRLFTPLQHKARYFKNKLTEKAAKIPVPAWAKKAVNAQALRTLGGRLGAKVLHKVRLPWKARDLTEEERARIYQTPQPAVASVASEAPFTTAVGAEYAGPTFTPQPRPTSSPAPAPRRPKFTPTPLEMPNFQKPTLKVVDAETEEIKKVQQIHRCIQNEKYRLYFQPILETHSRNKVMFETLLRLVDDYGELMQPPSFFPLAMKHGFVDQLDDMVIVASLRRHMEILTQGKNTILSINLSYGAFRSMNFMQTYKDGLKTGLLKPHLLNFELSSREIIEDDAAMKFVREMQKSGAKFSVDFFGDPQKTVQAAKKLKFDFMKVDCLKFPGLSDGEAEQVARFRDVIQAGHKNNLPMVAEKIETRSIMWLCEKLDVAYVQGFYLAEPSPKLNLGW